MALKDELTDWVDEVFRGAWTTRDGTQVPDDNSRLGLQNDGIKIEGTVLYADLADSTDMVDSFPATFSAEIYKTFLYCAGRIIRSHGGSITAYDGDRIMAVFIGNYKNTSAAKAAFQLKWAVPNIVTPAMRRIYPNVDFALKHVCGIDTSELLVAKTGVRGANDLVWVGRAANYAAKLSALPPSYTYITQSVYNKLNDEIKVKAGESMWQRVRWNTFNDTTIFRSSWHWSID